MATKYCEYNAFNDLERQNQTSHNFFPQFDSYLPMNKNCAESCVWDPLSPTISGSDSTASTPFANVKTEFPIDDELFGIDHQAKKDDALIGNTISSQQQMTKTQNDVCNNVKSEVVEDNNYMNFNVNVNPEALNDANVDAQQIDIYRDLILRHLIQDISTTCAKLGLPTDPYNWTEEHGARWISEMCEQFTLRRPKQMYLSGRVLLAMSQKDFESVAPEGGDTLHAQLQVWKTAFESYYQQQQCVPNGSVMCNMNNTSPMSKPNWMTSQTNNMIPENSSCYYPPGNTSATSFASETNGLEFFQPGVMPSPSNTDISSNGSHDVNEDESEMGFAHQPFIGIQHNGLCNTSSSGSDDDERCFGRHSGTVHLWHFIRELLDQPNQYGSCVRWVNREEGTFKIESSHHLARFWGQRKNRSQMNYDKLSRSLRQYYKKGIIQKPEKKQRLVYKFLPPYNL